MEDFAIGFCWEFLNIIQYFALNKKLNIGKLRVLGGIFDKRESVGQDNQFFNI
jgi:hypothetical protein